MKISKRIIGTSLAGVIVVGIVGWFLYKHFSKPAIVPEHQNETVQEQEQNNQKKAQNIDNSKNQDTYTPPDNSNNIVLTPEQTNGSQVTLTTKLSGYSDGTCTLTVTNGANSTSMNAQVLYETQFSTCAGFAIPVATLGSGTWNFNLSVTSGGVTVSKTATLEVK